MLSLPLSSVMQRTSIISYSAPTTSLCPCEVLQLAGFLTTPCKLARAGKNRNAWIAAHLKIMILGIQTSRNPNSWHCVARKNRANGRKHLEKRAKHRTCGKKTQKTNNALRTRTPRSSAVESGSWGQLPKSRPWQPKKRNSKMGCPGKCKHGPNPGVCPSDRFILSHCQLKKKLQKARCRLLGERQSNASKQRQTMYGPLKNKQNRDCGSALFCVLDANSCVSKRNNKNQNQKKNK